MRINRDKRPNFTKGGWHYLVERHWKLTLFEQLGYGPEERLMLGGLLCVVQLVGSTVPIFIIDRLGRRPLLIFGSFMLMSCHFINTAVVGTSSHDWVDHQAAAKAGTAFMFIFMFCFEISWGPIAWAIPSEIFPAAIRAQRVAMSTSSNWFNNFIVGLIVPEIITAAPYGSFALFACTSFLALVWVLLFFPETNRKTIEQLSGSDAGSRSDADNLERSQILSELLR